MKLNSPGLLDEVPDGVRDVVVDMANNVYEDDEKLE